MIAALIIAAAVTVFAVVSDDGEEAPPAAADGATQPAATTGERPAAPWRAAEAVPRRDVPPPYVSAWNSARNRASCALLFPIDGGPELAGATATSEKTPDDRGWNIYLTGDGGSVEVLALFDKATVTDRPAPTPTFTRAWADGSVAKYRPDVGNLAPGTYDPDTSAHEAVLTLPDQACAYRIYDSLGKEHLERLFDRLRLMAAG